MLNKLRWKVTLVATGIICIVLGLLAVGINLANRSISVHGVNELLKIIADNQGRIPGYAEMEEGHPDMWFYGITEETPYDTRFFVVWTDEDMNMMDSRMESVASVTGEEAKEYLSLAVQNGSSFGYAGKYRYYKCTDYGNTFFVFLDFSRQLNNSRNLLLVSLLVFGAAAFVTFLLAFLLSPKAIAPLVKNMERQKQFITNAGHELKTPLTVISACADVLDMDMPENEWVDGIRSETRRMAELVTDLVALSGWEEDEPAMEKRIFSVTQAVQECAEPFLSLCRARNKELLLEMPGEVKYNGDELAIRKMISVLLDNAVKYSQEESSIRLKLENRHRMLLIFVENQYTKVDGMDMSRLFERFYRGDLSRSRESGGSGIGLSIAKAVAEAHGGRIQAYAPDKGVICFRVSLPV